MLNFENVLGLFVATSFTMLGVGCADSGDENIGKRTLPQTGILPWTWEESNILIENEGPKLRSPVSLIGKNGASFILYTEEQYNGDAALWLSDENGENKQLAYAATQPWEAGRIIHPSAVSFSGLAEQTSGLNASLKIYYCAGSPSQIGLLEMEENTGLEVGTQFISAQAEPVFVAKESWEQGSVCDVSVVLHESKIYLYFIGGQGAGIGVATSNNGVDFKRIQTSPLVVRSSVDETNLIAFDSGGVYSPSVIIESQLGQTIFKMWYTGTKFENASYSLGYAASFDGLHFEKYTGNPIFTAVGDARDPYVSSVNKSYSMLWSGSDGISYAHQN